MFYESISYHGDAPQMVTHTVCVYFSDHTFHRSTLHILYIMATNQQNMIMYVGEGHHQNAEVCMEALWLGDM